MSKLTVELFKEHKRIWTIFWEYFREFHLTGIQQRDLCPRPPCPRSEKPNVCLVDRTPKICDFPEPKVSEREPCGYLKTPKSVKKCQLICPKDIYEWRKYKECRRMCLTTCGPRQRKTMYCDVPLVRPIREKLEPPLPAYSECRCSGKPTIHPCPECGYKRKAEKSTYLNNIACKVPVRAQRLKCSPRPKPKQKPWAEIKEPGAVCEKNIRMDDVVPPRLWRPLPPVLPLSNFTRPRVDKVLDLSTYVPPGRRFSTFTQQFFDGFHSGYSIRLFTVSCCLDKESKFPEAKKIDWLLEEKCWRIVKEYEAKNIEAPVENCESVTPTNEVPEKAKKSSLLKAKITEHRTRKYYSTFTLQKRTYSGSRPKHCEYVPRYQVQCATRDPMPPCMPPPPFQMEKCVSNMPCGNKCKKKVGAMQRGSCAKMCVCPVNRESRDFCVVELQTLRYKKVECPSKSFSEMKRFQFAERPQSECTLQKYKRHQTLMRESRLPKLTELNGKLYNLCR